MTDPLQKAVLATIVYYDVLDFPLTLLEVKRFLINSVRLGSAAEQKGTSLTEVDLALRHLLIENKIQGQLGFYFLPGRQALCQERLERIKIADEKWKKARRALYFVQAVPFIEAILASGSLALGHASEESDLDVLVVAKSNRIWLTRLLLLGALELLGVRRRKDDRMAPDKICPNHFITTASLHIPFHSLYNAQTYLSITPLFLRRKELAVQWRQANDWAGSYVQHWPEAFVSQRSPIRTNWFLRSMAWISERTLNLSGLGATLEKIARKIQLSRLDFKLPGRITANDQQLEFHPYSAEKKVLEQYHQRLVSYPDFGAYHELDSGLK